MQGLSIRGEEPKHGHSLMAWHALSCVCSRCAYDPDSNHTVDGVTSQCNWESYGFAIATQGGAPPAARMTAVAMESSPPLLLPRAWLPQSIPSPIYYPALTPLSNKPPRYALINVCLGTLFCEAR